MSTFIFIAKKESNGFWPRMDFGSPYNEARLKDFLKANEGKKFRIAKQVSTRTLSQNKLYWLYLEQIELETGNNGNDLHELFKRTLLKPKFITVLGQEIKIPMSTTELNKMEFIDYLDKIAATTNVPIPDTEAYNRYINSAPMVDDN